MPELPEVETVRRDLESFLVGARLNTITIKPDFHKRISPAPEKFVKFLVKQKLRALDRVGKLLIFDFGTDLKLLAHLKMTGQFILIKKNKTSPAQRFTKAIFDFGTRGQLLFNDIRKFGYLKLVTDKLADLEKKKYGPEPIQANFTFAKFNEILNKKKNLAIKKVLLMQDQIAGIGNIYADEADFSAGIRGTRKIKTLSLSSREKLFQALKTILRQAILKRGTSVNTYVDGHGQKGNYVNFLKVYGRVGQPCQKCQTIIKKIKFGGRSMSFCPQCQK